MRAKGLLPPYERPPAKKTREDRIAYMKDWHRKRKERMAADPEYAEKIKAQSLARALAHYDRKLAAQGKPPVVRQPKMSDEERKRRNTELKRRSYRVKHGIPLDAPFGYRKPKDKPAAPKVSARDQERIRRAAEIEAAKAAAARNPIPPAPTICPDPPELQALFAKASKGEPPRPLVHHSKKRTAFQIRGWV